MNGETCGGIATLVERLDDFGDRQALGLRGEYGVRWLTFRTVRDRAWQVAALLAEMGIERGDHVVIWSANSPDWVVCLVGALLRGVVVVAVDEDASPEFLAQVVRETGARAVFHRIDLDPAFLPVPAAPLERLRTPRRLERVAVAVAPGDPALIIYTSGSTSTPRGVLLTHQNIDAQMRRFLGWRWLLRVVPFRMLVIAPLSHVQGLLLGALVPLSAGVSVVFVRSVYSAHLLRTIRDNRIVLLAAVPRALAALRQAIEARPRGRESLGRRLSVERRGWMRRHVLFTELNRIVGWRFWVVLVGGAVLDAHDEQFWRDTGRFVVQGYGLTETTALVALNGPFSRRVGSIGKPLKHLSVRIADDGELLVRGASVSPGYVSAGAGASTPPADGYLRTGDLIRRSRGHLYFMGRKKDLIVTGEGHNIAPAEVEAALTRTAGVIDAVVVPRSVDGSEEVHAVLLLRSDVEAADVVRRANETLQPFQRIRGWTTWPERDFPRGALLKVRRHEIAARLGSLPAAPGAPSGESRSLAEIAAEPDRRTRIEWLARYLGQATTPLSASAACARLETDFGLSSLDRVALLGRIEQLGDVVLEHASLPRDATLGDLHEVLCTGSPGSASRHLPTRQVSWAEWLPMAAVRAAVRPLAVGIWQRLRGRCTARWEVNPSTMKPPFFLAVAPHHHWLDAFVVSAALPARLARRMLVVTNRDFSEFFDRDRPAAGSERLIVGLGYYLWLPFTFPFTIVPEHGSTREGLRETLRWVDRGYCPLMFPKGILAGTIDPARHDPGAVLMALETGVPIVPVWIRGNETSGWRPRFGARRIEVRFGAPATVQPGDEPGAIQERIEAAWAGLAGAGTK